MRHTQNITITHAEPMHADIEETTWSLSGAVVGFVAWLLATCFYVPKLEPAGTLGYCP